MVNTDLLEWAKKRAPSVNAILAGEGDTEVTGIYRGAKEGVNAFGAETIFYQVEIDSRTIPFQSTSGRIAMIFSNIEEGQEITIGRTINEKTGKGNYDVWVPGKKNKKA